MNTPVASFSIGSSPLILAGNMDMHKGLDVFEIWPDPTKTTVLAALKFLKNQCIML